MMDYGPDALYYNDDMDMDGQDDHVSGELENFEDFCLRPEIMKAIDGVLQYPTEVQNGCLFDAMQGKDILCQSKAGSGKATLSVLAVLHQLNYTEPGVYVLIICPARHLITKIIDCFKTLARYMPQVKVDTFGQKAGTLAVTTGAHVGLGTPGRISRAVRNRKVDFSHVNHVVLYEADKMLSMLDMRSDIEEICRQLPKNRQMLMFSEKFSKEARPICKQFLKQPKVFVDDEAKYISGSLDQFYIKLSDTGKQSKLIEILNILHFSLIIVYVKSPNVCDTITNMLKEAKLSATGYHLGMKVANRTRSISQFKSLKKRILVAAKQLEPEVALDTVNVVIMYDKPADVDLYLKYVTPASKSQDTNGLTITFLPENDDMKMIQELEDWYSANFTELPNKIQLEVTSYNCDP